MDDPGVVKHVADFAGVLLLVLAGKSWLPFSNCTKEINDILMCHERMMAICFFP